MGPSTSKKNSVSQFHLLDVSNLKKVNADKVEMKI